MHKVSAAILFFALQISSSHANDANWTGIGDAGAFTKNSQIQMVSEVVNITISDDWIFVRATYNFKNHGATTTVQMGYPDETVAWEKPRIDKIYSKVDGKPVALSFKSTNKTTKPVEEYYANAAWVKSVRFTAGQNRTVTVFYRAKTGFSAIGCSTYYVLKSGNTWKGRILDAQFNINWSGVRSFSRPALEPIVDERGKPLPWRIGKTSASLRLRNFKPSYNLNLSILNGFWNFTINGRRLSQELATPNEADAPVKREGKEVLVCISSLQWFFSVGSRWVDTKPWSAPEAKKFGKLEFLSNNEFVDARGRNYKLRRPAVENKRFYNGNLDSMYIYLSDLVRALGGTYTFRTDLDRVDITLPRGR